MANAEPAPKTPRDAPPGAPRPIEPHPPSNERLWKLTLGALGVVYGDIGTSPLYAIRECFAPAHGLALTSENIYGILSLIFWALTLVVTIKYLTFILRADNHGEGGIMALIAMILPRPSRHSALLLFLGLFGAALLYGDGIITPAISVLSAIEGLEVATPAFRPFIVPVTVAILILLFWFQSRGTEKIGAIFGPAMALWFVTIAVLAVPWIARHPEILLSVHPGYAIRFFEANGMSGFLVLSAVVLCITGAEALYADMGHFGKRPIRVGWFGVVFPALIINYFGQGALILDRGSEALKHPFYGLVSGLGPEWLLYPLVAIAALATVIASQALISGAYSLTQQAIQLGYLPRTHIEHTSKETHGQIFIGQINRFLMVGSIGLVLIFGHSSNLAAAYGVAVTGTMITTSVLFFAVVKQIWKWQLALSLLLVSGFLLVDSAFFLANIGKFAQGGWIPVLIALSLYTVMTTWKRGKEALSQILLSTAMPLEQFLTKIPRKKPPRVPGTAIFMTQNENIAPFVLLHHFKHNRALHERVILLSIVTKNIPYVAENDRLTVRELPYGFYRIQARYGFMEKPDISEILILCIAGGLPLNVDELSFYLGRESFLTTGDTPMWLWRKKLFVILSRNARPATDYFALPPDQVIEIGTQVLI